MGCILWTRFRVTRAERFCVTRSGDAFPPATAWPARTAWVAAFTPPSRPPFPNWSGVGGVPYQHTASKSPFFKVFLNIFWGDFLFFLYCIQHCFICRPSDSTVPTDAGIEPRTVATGALAVRRANHYMARSKPPVMRKKGGRRWQMFVMGLGPRLSGYFSLLILLSSFVLIYFRYRQSNAKSIGHGLANRQNSAIRSIIFFFLL